MILSDISMSKHHITFNTIEKIMSFGCSFTEGIGMHCSKYFSWLEKYHPEKLKNYTEFEFYQRYYIDKSYPALLANLLGCSYENHGIGCSSNELIIKTLHEKTSSVLDGSKILITIQPTFMHRMHVYDSLNNEHLRFNNLYTPQGNLYKDIPSNEYYEMYLKYFFNDIYELNKLVNYLFTIIDSLTSKNFTVLILPYQNPMQLKYSFLKSKYVCNEFLNVEETKTYTSIFDLLEISKLCLKDLHNIQWDDSHANETGHEQIAKSIYKHLKKYYNEN